MRFGEVDRQGVVFNSHYLAYVDDAMETWLRPIRAQSQRLEWDMMLRKCTIEWHTPVGTGDRLDIDVAVSRWGRSSWDLDYVGRRQGRLVFTARVAYVSVEPGTGVPMETPREIRDFMGETVDLVGGAAGDGR